MIAFSPPDLPYKLQVAEHADRTDISVEINGVKTQLLRLGTDTPYHGAKAAIAAFAVDAVCQVLNAGISIDCIRQLCDLAADTLITHSLDPVYFFATSQDTLLVLGSELQQMFYVYLNNQCVHVLEPSQYAEWYADHEAVAEGFDDIFENL